MADNADKLGLGAINFIAGTVGGLAGVLAGQPLDTVKVRLQVQGKRYYKGTLDCLIKIVREEKVVGLFKGMSSPMVGTAAINALLFGVYGFILESQLSYHSKSVHSIDSLSLSANTPTLSQIFIAGAGSGLVNSVVSCPTELAKIRLQNQTDASHSLVKLSSSTPHFKGPVHVLRFLYSAHGIRGLFTGITPTILRETPSYGVYFFTYELLCRLMAPTPSLSIDQSQQQQSASAPLSSIQLALAGGLAGVAGWMSTYPTDVVKTKMQSVDRGIYSSTWSCFTHTVKSEGLHGLFRGGGATILRAFPTNAATFVAWHYSVEGLKRWSIDSNQ